MKDNEEKTLEFYKKHFQAHLQRIFEYQKERFRLASLSVAGTAGYYAWVFSDVEKIAQQIPLRLVLLLPLVFNLVGLVYNFVSHRILDRHTGFLDHLEKKLFPPGPSEWTKYRSSDEKEKLGKPIRYLSYVFWLLMVMLSIIILYSIKN